MTETDSGSTVGFDHYDAAFAANPYPVLAELRAHCPVAHTDAHGGFWLVTRYDDVRYVALHPDAFSSRYTSVPTNIGLGDFPIPPVQLDPPAHARVKQLLTPAFVPARAAALEEWTRRIAIDLLGALAKRGRFDASEEYARLVPTAVVCQLLGLPESLDLVTGWVKRLLEQAASNADDAQVAGMELFTFTSDVVAKRKTDPGDDLVSAMLASEVDGERLSDDEVTFAAILLVVAGIDTTWNTLASAVHYLATHPEDQARLRGDATLIPTATEEFLRAFAPVTPARIVRDDVELGGCTLRAGEMVLVSFPSANRDEAEFEDPAEIRLDRTPNRHLAFGTGIHRCLGVNFARMELRVALEELVCRVGAFRLADPSAVTWTRGQVRGPRQLEIELDT